MQANEFQEISNMTVTPNHRFFVWSSLYLAEQYPGTIVVMADTVEMARQKVLDGFRAQVIERYGSDAPESQPLEDRRKILISRTLLECDLAKAPQIQEDYVFVIGAS